MNQRRKINDRITKASRDKRVVSGAFVLSISSPRLTINQFYKAPYLLLVASFLYTSASHLRIKSFCL